MTDGSPADETLSRLEYHVLLAMAPGPLYGYALKEAVEEESGGALAPRAATLYRLLARLMERGVVEEVAAPADTPPHPGRPRQYYGLTAHGTSLLIEETRRIQAAATLARDRLGMAETPA
jgi:DNA-binding PadR family transcriptional regulator